MQPFSICIVWTETAGRAHRVLRFTVARTHSHALKSLAHCARPRGNPAGPPASAPAVPDSRVATRACIACMLHAHVLAVGPQTCDLRSQESAVPVARHPSTRLRSHALANPGTSLLHAHVHVPCTCRRTSNLRSSLARVGCPCRTASFNSLALTCSRKSAPRSMPNAILVAVALLGRPRAVCPTCMYSMHMPKDAVRAKAAARATTLDACQHSRRLRRHVRMLGDGSNRSCGMDERRGCWWLQDVLHRCGDSLCDFGQPVARQRTHVRPRT